MASPFTPSLSPWLKKHKRSNSRNRSSPSPPTPAAPPPSPEFNQDEIVAADALILLSQRPIVIIKNSTDKPPHDHVTSVEDVNFRRPSTPPLPPPIVNNNSLEYGDAGDESIAIIHQDPTPPIPIPTPTLIRNIQEAPVESDNGGSSSSNNGNNDVVAPIVSRKRIFRCRACGKCFSSGQSLGGHQRKHYLGRIVRNQGNNAVRRQRLNLDLSLRLPGWENRA